YYTWFAGFFPVIKPKYTIVILFDEPQKLYEEEKIGGGSVSAPILKDLVDRIMFYKKIKPDKGSD
ncbi:MAG: penicillin-binding protein 2, partial [Persephonella sp.]